MIEPGIRHAVAETLSKLNVHSWTWQKIKAELRSPLIGVSATSVDDLQRFDFRGMTILCKMNQNVMLTDQIRQIRLLQS
jgi:hypothetical protein